MKLPENFYHRLTVAHSIFLSILILGGVAAGISAIPKLKAKLSKQSLSHVKPTFKGKEIPVEKFELKIKANEARQIEELIAKINAKGILTNEDKRWFQAAFYHNGVKYKCKIRPRGDLKAHWSDAKRSWRVKFSKNRLFRDLREINLVIPSDKSYVLEFLGYQLASQEGLLVPDHGLATAKINNVDMGAYLWFEQWDRTSMTKRNVPEGEIYGEANVWLDTRLNSMSLNGLIAHPAAYKEMTRSDDEPLLHQKKWLAFLDLVFSPDDKKFWEQIPSYVDMDKYHRWNALTWLFNSTHSHWGDNLRWFFNPKTSKFEPIPYDLSLYDFDPSIGVFDRRDHDYLARRLYVNPEFLIKRNQAIKRLSAWMEVDGVDFVRSHFSALAPYLQRGIGKDKLAAGKVLEVMQNQIDKLASVRNGLYSQIDHARLFYELDLTKLPQKAELKLQPEVLGGLNQITISLPLKANKTPTVFLRQGTRAIPLIAKLEEGSLIFSIQDSLLVPRLPGFEMSTTPWIVDINLQGSGQSTSTPISIQAKNIVSDSSLPSAMIYGFKRMP